jgi:NAD(P)-dependent dehydrogenase (short-subunit alcohol dehydrogenase family)
VVLITGGASGIGAALAREMAPLSHATEVSPGDRLIFVGGLTAKTPAPGR